MKTTIVLLSLLFSVSSFAEEPVDLTVNQCQSPRISNKRALKLLGAKKSVELASYESMKEYVRNKIGNSIGDWFYSRDLYEVGVYLDIKESEGKESFLQPLISIKTSSGSHDSAKIRGSYYCSVNNESDNYFNCSTAEEGVTVDNRKPKSLPKHLKVYMTDNCVWFKKVVVNSGKREETLIFYKSITDK